MKQKPKLAIPKSTSEKLANIIGYSIFAGALIYVFIAFPSLPEEIPMHFGAGGEVNRYGSPYELLVLVFIPFILIIMLEALERFPEMHNYPRRMDESNVGEFYLNSRKMLNFSKNACLIIFAVVFIEIINYGLTGISSFGALLLPVILIIVFSPIVWGLWTRSKIK